MKARLRAWLIDLVREAIRVERASLQTVRSIAPKPPFTVQQVEAVERQAVERIHRAPSFEQLQDDALAAQEKFYAPESK